jgi:hypothetical protein
VIVLDEQLHGARTIAALSSWYRGRVISVTALRPHSVIKDDAIPMLLRGVRQPTFVTINVADFWRKAPAHNRYCIVTLDVPTERIWSVPDLLRRLLHLPNFATKAMRTGKVVRVTPHVVEFYGPDGRVQTLRFTTQ